MPIPSLTSSDNEEMAAGKAFLAERHDDAPLIQYVAPKNARPYLRSYTKNAREPTPAQIDNQRRFGDVARAQTGATGFEGGVPVVANAISERHSRGLAAVPAREERPLTKTEHEIVEYWLPRIAAFVAVERHRRQSDYEIID